MTADEIEAARELVGCEDFDWHSMRGADVLDENGEPIGRLLGYANAGWWVGGIYDGCEYAAREIGKRAGRDPEDGGWMLPDLSSPATIGCLASLAREVCDDPGLHAERWAEVEADLSEGAEVWFIAMLGENCNRVLSHEGPTEGIAWAHAIMAAPDRS